MQMWVLSCDLLEGAPGSTGLQTVASLREEDDHILVSDVKLNLGAHRLISAEYA